MRQSSRNLKLPLVDSTDMFYAEEHLNSAMQTIDTNVSDLQDGYNDLNMVVNQAIADGGNTSLEVVQARKGKTTLKDKIDDIDSSLINIEYDLTKDGILAGQDISVKLQNAINTGYITIKLKENTSYKINSVINLPNYQITLKGNATTITTDMLDGAYTVLFDKGSNANAGIIFDKIYFASRNHRTTNATNQNNFNFGNIYSVNNPSSLFGAFDVANFGGQGLSTASAPIGFALHHYTDGHMVQIDNVGTGNCILTLKNAWNKLRRMDKDSLFVGSGDYFRILQSATDGNTETVSEIFKLDKFGDLQFTKNLVDIVNNKTVDGGFWSFRMRNANRMNYVFCLQNGTDQVLQVTTDTALNVNKFTLSGTVAENDFYMSKMTMFNNTASNDGFYGFFFKNTGAKDYLFSVSQNSKSMITTRLDTVDIYSVHLPTLGTPPTAQKGIIYFDGTNFKACKDGSTYATLL